MENKALLKSILENFDEFEWKSIKDSKIVDFYKNKKVFVTGATGFFGKLVVEKLLRACPDIDTIFILVRPKKEENAYERVDKLYSQQVFYQLRKMFPKFQHKICIVNGDVALPDLGLSDSDKKTIIEQVDVIFHMAATVRFDEKITTALATNVRGTRDLLNIAKQSKRVKSFVHVSTAYANCKQDKIDEVFYPPPVSSEELITMLETRPESELLKNSLKIQGTWPNTYTFSKAIAEEVIYTQSTGIPTCIVRPSIVVATYKEPLKNWIDNLYGATGIVVGAGTGLLKTFHCDKEKAAEIVPADYVINNMIAASYQNTVEKSSEVKIYNYVSSTENRHNWEDFMKTCRYYGVQVPTINCVWYYNLTLNKYFFIHMFYCIFLHFIPGLILDLGLILTKQKPIMTKIYKKIHKFEDVIAHFATMEWKFYNNNTQALWNELSDADQKMFPFSIKQINWKEYHKTLTLGLRVYLLNDDLSTLPQAQKKWRRFYIADRIIKFIFYGFCLYLGVSLLFKIVY